MEEAAIKRGSASRGELASSAGLDICQRSFAFGVRILRLTRALPRDTAGQIVARQLGRSGTSIGANIEEAQAAHSRVDFARRMNIARAESKETLYWLRLVGEASLLPKHRLAAVIIEADELVRVLTSIVQSSRRRGSTDKRNVQTESRHS